MNSILVSKSEFKAKALEYFWQVEAFGTSIIVTNHGKPTLEVRPYEVGPCEVRPYYVEPLDVLRGSVLKYDSPLEPVAIW